MKKALPILLLCLLLCGCTTPIEETVPMPTEQPEDSAVKLDISVISNRAQELVFDISMDDFIDSYNSFYNRDRAAEYLLPKLKW